MNANGPTFRLLDGGFLGNPENAASHTGVSMSGAGLALGEDNSAGSALALNSADGSAGRLALPRRIAVARDGAVYLLGPGQPWIKRFDVGAGQFERLRGIGHEGSAARQFNGAVNIAIAGGNLYVADRGNERIQVFALPRLILRYVWDGLDAADVASASGLAYILDAKRGRVYRHRPGIDEPTLLMEQPEFADRWSRILVDNAGRVYLLDAAKARLQIYSATGEPLGTAAYAGDVRDRFPTPAVVYLTPPGAFQLPGGSTFDAHGRPVAIDPSGPLGPHRYQLHGEWVSKPLDSGTYRCQWHRIEAEAELPPGARIVVSTLTASDAGSTESAPGDDAGWLTRFTIGSPMQAVGRPAVSTDFLVQSVEGQYLWVKVEFDSDGYATPALRLLRIHFPRQSYLEYLPGIYSYEEESRRFLERFLAVFQTEWERLERANTEIARYFDPAAVPPEFLEYLAEWLALPLEQSWSVEQKRKLLEAAPRLYSRLGTPDGVRESLRVTLENLGGRSTPDYPVLIEGFRARKQLLSLGSSALGTRSAGAPLWSTGVVGRLQIGVHSRAGEARLVSAGDPETDVFRVYAHRFQVFVPANFIRTASDERVARRAIDRAKPAGAAYDLCLVESRLRLGIQSTVGVDTLVGAYPVTRLSCASEDESAAPSRAPSCRLGFDTVLAPGATDDAGFPLFREGTRAGAETILR